MPGTVLNASGTLSHRPVGSYPHFIGGETKAQAGYTANRQVHTDLADSRTLVLIPEGSAPVAAQRDGRDTKYQGTLVLVSRPLLTCHKTLGNVFNLPDRQSLHL